MQLEIPIKSLVAALDLCKRVAGTNKHIPYLQNVVMLADSDDVFLRATNIDVDVRIQLAASVERSGAVAVSACELAKRLAAADRSSKCVLTLCEEVLHGVVGPSKFELPTAPIDDMPVSPVRGSLVAQLGASALFGLLAQTSYAASADISRGNLTGVCLSPTKSGWCAVATDGSRLAVAETPNDKPSIWSCLIPREAACFLQRALQHATGIVGVYVNNDASTATFAFGQVELTARLGDATTFPNWKQIIPTGPGVTVIADRRQFIAALKATPAKAVTLRATPESCTVSGDGASTVIECDASGPFEVCINRKYLIEALSARRDPVSIEYHLTEEPIVIRTQGQLTAVIMPIRR